MATQAEHIPPVVEPIIVGRDDRSARGEVGAHFYFAQLKDPANAKISTDRPDVLQLIQGHKEPSWESTCGAHALRPGMAQVDIVPSPADPDQDPVAVRITVSGPAPWMPK